MKKITILMLTIAALLLASCKKDENTTPDGGVISPEINNGFRVVEIKSKNYSSKIEYNKDNKVTQYVGTDSYNGEESKRKYELSYNGNEITEKVYKEENGEWVQDDGIHKSIVENGLLKESITTYTYTNEQNVKFERENKVIYTYEGKKLVAKEEHRKQSESQEVEVEKYEYKYKDGKFVEVLKFHNGTKTSRKLLVYNGDKIEKIESYDYNTETKEFVKSDDEKRYTYSGNNVSKIEYWSGEELITSEKYKYDDNGNLIEEAFKYKEEEEEITSYKYEKGNGNGYIFNDPEDYIFKMPLFH